MPKEDRKLAAIVFTDICGFTELMGYEESKAMALLDLQRELLKPIVSEFDGEWLKEIGDGLLLSFPSSVNAVSCSVKIQKLLSDNSDLTLRIGIHIGDVIIKDGDAFGDGVNIASRIEPLSQPGGICVSERVYEHIENRSDISASFQEEKLLKGTDKPIGVYSVFTGNEKVPKTRTKNIPRKVTKSKMPYIIAGIMMGLLVSVFALKSTSGDSKPLVGNSLAVFNFENLSAENENDRTGQILQELIITDLSGINDFKIYSSQRLFDIQKQMGTRESRFIDPSLSMDIAKEAGASSMMTGNIIKVGNTVILTSRLLDVVDGTVIKSRKVEGDNIYEMVDQLSSYVIEDLQLGVIETVNLAVSGKTSSSMEAYQIYLNGVDLLNQRRFKDAANELERAVEIDPSFKEALYKLAIAQWWEKGPETMIDEMDSLSLATLDKYLALSDIRESEIKLGKGLKNIILNKYSDALEAFEQLTSLYPDNKEYWYLFGEVHYHGEKKLIKALDAFERAVELDPEFTLAYEHIFGIYDEQQLYERGIRSSRKLVKAFPENSMGYYHLIRFYRLTEKYNLALEMLETAKKTFPDKVSLYQRTIALVNAHMGRYKDALTILDDMENAPKSDIRFIYSILGQYSKCREFLQIELSSAEKSPSDLATINMGFALTYLNGGEYAKAAEYFNSSLKILDENPGSMMTRYSKYNVYYNRSMLHVFNSENESLFEAVDLYANYLNEENKQSPLIEIMEPGFKALSFEKLAAEGNIEEALVQFQKIPIRNASMEWHYYTAAKLYINIGDYENALKCADEMQVPTARNWRYDFVYPRGHYIRGMTYEAMGDSKKAKKSYESLLELWKNADEGIPELVDTKARYKNLQKTS